MIRISATSIALAWALALGAGAASAQTPAAGDDGLLFRASGDKGATADKAGGDAVPNFQSKVTNVADGALGGAFRWADDGYLAWNAPGNIQAQRGTLAFFWRPRDPLGEAPFVIFRAGYADHSSWDMAFLRIDWNGHGFDAFVTDANLSRVRVSFELPEVPAPDAWQHIAFAWDETAGVRLFVDGKEVARNPQKADLDAALDQFGMAGRVMAPHQVQSRYNFMRGSDLDEIRVYDHMLDAAGIAALAAKAEPAPASTVDPAGRHAAWLHRFGWDTASPPVLDDKVTRVRKVEFSDARDLKEWMWKGVDGIAETTWPGVYNRSKLPGRDDYFELPDWNVYVEGGKTYTLTVPQDEKFNRVEIRGAAYGTLDYAPDGSSFRNLARRPRGVVRSITSLGETQGGTLRFVNTMQEQPIQEIWTYDVGAGKEPAGSFKLSYTVNAGVSADLAALDSLNRFIRGRYPADERNTVLALPPGAGNAAAGAGSAASTGAAAHIEGAMPIVHVLIPSGFGDAYPGRPLARAWNYGWENGRDGLDGIAIDIPALKVTPGKDGLIPLNIKVKDPIWPGRDMIDLSVSVRAGEARTLWLDLRDRILTNDSLYLSVASAAPDFGPAALEGMNIRLVFKDRAAALPEHVADRLNQVKDNWAFLVEEHTASKRAALYTRVFGDVRDLLRVDPDNALGRTYWADISYGAQNLPEFKQPEAPAGVPLWAFRQLEDLRLTREFVNWWIDNRQVPYGDFGGGISDDTDLTQQWPGLALMGVDPDKINGSLRALSEAVYKNGMMVNGLGHITTDELHAYEEGMNSDAERLYLNWGEPRAVERLMATVKALKTVILTNPAGHMHFATNWYGARKIYREGPFEWQKPYSWVVLHAPVLVGLYNGNPDARGLITGTVDGLLAHGKQDAKGNWSYPNEINWRSDAERAGDGGGAATPLQAAWAAYRFSGDAKYLTPILARVGRSGPASVADLNENVVKLLGADKDWSRTLADKAKKGGAFEQWAAWDATGNTGYLETLHAAAIEDKAQHQYMYTQGHWWSDRVDQPNEILQRERLGGIALRRNQTWPGNAVSWRFDDPEGAMKTAILVPGATPTHFKVIGYNVGDTPQAAEMTAWNVTAGEWEMTSSAGSTPLHLERSASTRVTFAPHATTEIEFTLKTPGDDVTTRPDLGIGSDDVVVKGGRLAVTVHSLGARDTTGGTLTVEDASGKPLASAAIPALAAPLDLLPRTATVRLALPKGAVRVRVALPGNAPEVTLRNNMAALPR
jgi:hypothetical protein